LNTGYAYKVEIVDATAATGKPPVGDATAESNAGAKAATMVPPGYVGVVTNKAPDRAENKTQGIQAEVLQPGIYFLNPAEKQVDVLLVGFNEYSVTVQRSGLPTNRPEVAAAVTTASDFVVEPDPEYEPGQGIDFPAADGSTIHLDFTAIWGIMPEQAPDVVRQFGTLKDVETKVVAPQINSVCRLFGSKRRAVELLVGDTREQFQDDVSKELEQVLKGKDLTLLFGLTRHIYVPARVREPIQRAKIADELRLTRDQEQLTAKAQADLTEAIAKVTLEETRTESETQRLVAEALATGAKSVAEIEANTSKTVAAIEAGTAQITAQIERTIGEADAKKVELVNEAQAERFGLYVQALGGAENYNRYSFAEGLPKDMSLGIIYAGPGTFWTDLKGFDRTLMGKIAAEAETKDPATLPKLTELPAPTATRP
jgi:regulator of protease activity HflC (stomatin/prohibitin superfamily)